MSSYAAFELSVGSVTRGSTAPTEQGGRSPSECEVPAQSVDASGVKLAGELAALGQVPMMR
jgi:hypothetical protein